MNDLDTFISGLYATGSHVKTSGLDAFGVSDLGRLYGTPAKHLEAAEKLAHDAACFLSQFDGTPLHAQAIALIGEELRLEAERIQRDEARRAQQEPMDDSWSKQRMIDLKKRQLELELHKAKAQHEGAEGQEQEAQEHAEGVPAPQTTGAVPAKTAAINWVTPDVLQAAGQAGGGSSPGTKADWVAGKVRRSMENLKLPAGHLAEKYEQQGGHAGLEDRVRRAMRGVDLPGARGLDRKMRLQQAKRIIGQVRTLKTSGLKLAAPADIARGLLTGAKKEPWRNAAQYMSPADLLGKAVQSAKAQSGGMSRNVADYVKKTAALRAARGHGR